MGAGDSGGLKEGQVWGSTGGKGQSGMNGGEENPQTREEKGSCCLGGKWISRVSSGPPEDFAETTAKWKDGSLW